MILKAFAKINLSLNILSKRDDGFHELESVVLPIKLHDVIEVTVLRGDFIYDSIICDTFSLKESKYNLCSKAISYLRQKFGFKEYFQVIIHKAIPVQAGLGGGSSDAAAVIKCVQKLLNLNITSEDLEEIAGIIGCDVPFFLKSESCIMTGLGEHIEVFESKFKPFILLVKPEEGLATVETFGAFDKKHKQGKIPHSAELIEACNKNDLEKVRILANNDLQEVAEELVPEIKKIKENLLDDGFEMVQMTGSGSTVFALTNNKKLWKKSHKKYSELGYETIATKLL